MSQESLISIMFTPSTTMDNEVVKTEEDMLEIVMEVEEAALEVAEVLTEVPKSPRMLRPKLTPTKESEKKRRQPTIPMRASLRRSPPKDKPTT